jgi:hypothetical protein
MEGLLLGTWSIHRTTQRIELCEASQAFFDLSPSLPLTDFLQGFSASTAQSLSAFFDQIKTPHSTIQHQLLLTFLDNRASKLVHLTASYHQDTLICHCAELQQEAAQQIISMQQQLFMFNGIFNGLADPVFVKARVSQFIEFAVESGG